MATNFKAPTGLFYAAWIVFSALAIPLALGATFVILALITDQIGGTLIVDGQRRITEDYLFSSVFVSLFWLLTSFLQYIILRRYLPKMGWWLVATGLGWLSVWGIMQKFNYFGSVLFTDLGLLLFFPLIGTLIGFFQWLLLRRRIKQAAWWILASMLGWGLAALGTQSPVRNGSILAQLFLVGLSPAIVTGFAWWFLWKQQPQSQVENSAIL